MNEGRFNYERAREESDCIWRRKHDIMIMSLSLGVTSCDTFIGGYKFLVATSLVRSVLEHPAKTTTKTASSYHEEGIML